MIDFSKLKEQLLKEEISFKEEEPLKKHCTFQIGGPADLYIMPSSQLELCKAILLCRAYRIPFLMLGKGSNILFSDKGFRGAVIDCTATKDEVSVKENRITASSGVTLFKLCRIALGNGLSGLEFAYGIPGSVGGAVYMNAGAYGGEIKDVLTGVTVLHSDGSVSYMDSSSLHLGYRSSIFSSSDDIILSADFTLTADSPEKISERMDDLLKRRKDKQPIDKPSAGSTFKRPEGAYAAALIDSCGLKGFRIGGAKVSEKHSGFVINAENASASDVLLLCNHISHVVYSKTGFLLEKEIKIIGEE